MENSNCCNAKIWLIGASRRHPRLDRDDPDTFKKVERGRTYYYECDKCNNPCDPIPNKEDSHATDSLKYLDPTINTSSKYKTFKNEKDAVIFIHDLRLKVEAAMNQLQSIKDSLEKL